MRWSLCWTPAYISTLLPRPVPLPPSPWPALSAAGISLACLWLGSPDPYLYRMPSPTLLAHIATNASSNSRLGPLLFLVYVNDMQISSDPDCKVLLYADDSAILFSHKDPRVISDKLSTVMRSCQDWLVDNKLSLHLASFLDQRGNYNRQKNCFV